MALKKKAHVTGVHIVRQVERLLDGRLQVRFYGRAGVVIGTTDGVCNEMRMCAQELAELADLIDKGEV